MSASEEISRLKEQVKRLEDQIKSYEEHVFILQNGIQFNNKSYQVEQAKQSNQIIGLASLLMDVIKEGRHYEEMREANINQRVNNILNIDITDFNSLNNAFNATNSVLNPNNDNSLMTNLNLSNNNTGSRNDNSGNTGSSTAVTSNNNTNNNHNNNSNNNSSNNNTSILSAANSLLPQNQKIPNDHLSSSSNSQNQPNATLLPNPLQPPTQSRSQAQLQEMNDQNQIKILQQNFERQHHQQRLQSRHSHERRNQQQETDQSHLSQGILSQSLPSQQVPQQNRKNRIKRRKTLNDETSILLDEALNYAERQQRLQENQVQAPHIQQIQAPLEIQPQRIQSQPNSISNPLQPVEPSSNLETNSPSKRRKVYDKVYSFIKAPNSVEEIWNEYFVGVDNQPSIKALEEEYKTGWRKDPATSKKFNRRKAIYNAIEKGLQKGYSLSQCITLLEDFRWIDRAKNLKQPIGWLCHGNLPNELK
ncbi:hypothetical protein WICMUC_003341 [Wickerhamomyces mucosus]|uniref:Transcription activator GCR1-like domain-containing protein n=1 Tax=Wickerhamomyces mucosus TaxID=1378264 RepID=A0A9P8PLJ3_9ASCO|nr:hypothetical protein WICMUC_003341 [Wickerhamomyces mucosus]